MPVLKYKTHMINVEYIAVCEISQNLPFTAINRKTLNLIRNIKKIIKFLRKITIISLLKLILIDLTCLQLLFKHLIRIVPEWHDYFSNDKISTRMTRLVPGPYYKISTRMTRYVPEYKTLTVNKIELSPNLGQIFLV